MLAANLLALSMPMSSLLTPNVAAVEPVKKVLTPSDARTPLLSSEKAKSISGESELICSLPAEVTLAEIPSTSFSCFAKSLSVVSPSMPSRSMLIFVVFGVDC